MTTGFLYEARFLDHVPGPGHPECAARLSNSIAHLQDRHWFGSLARISPVEADTDHVRLVHTKQYIERARQASASGEHYLDCQDVGINSDSFTVASLAAGALISIADQLIAGDVRNAFAMTRPPGHHAEQDLAMGFCIFNNVAILARYLKHQHGLDKIAILDWDVHHGNGTQHIFEADPSVLYASVHQYPYYPGTGAYTENGIGRGKGTTLNCPVPEGAGDKEYELIFSDRILSSIDAFKPELIIISAGFDAHWRDPLAGIQLSTGFYGWMTTRVMELAHKHCAGRIISVLEGGYDLEALPLCIEEHLIQLAEINDTRKEG